MTSELAPGIYGGERGLAAYLAYMGVESLEELDQEQLPLFAVRSHNEDPHERRPSSHSRRSRKAA
jgi:hypothetical protein